MEDGPDLIGRRIAAALLDVLVLAVIFFVVAVTIGETETSDSSASFRLEDGQTLAFAALSLLYYYLGESLTGQTLGKRVLKLRVVDAQSGGQPGAGRIAVRTILRVVDSFPIFYLVGFITMLVTGKRRQRVGDIAARTRVVEAGRQRRS